MKRMAMLVAVLAMACGGSESDPADPSGCAYARSTVWHGSTATVAIYDRTGAVAAWCEVPAVNPLLATCSDDAGNAVSVPAPCVENLPTDAPPHG